MAGVRVSKKVQPLQGPSDALAHSPAFIQAVQRGIVEDAAQVAADILLVQDTQAPRPWSLPGGAQASSMLNALFNVGDEVMLKNENKGCTAVVGTVLENTINLKGTGQRNGAAFRIRWRSGQETTEFFEDLRISKKNRIDTNIRKISKYQSNVEVSKIGTPHMSIMQKAPPFPIVTVCKDQITEISKQLLAFEDSLGWDLVDAEKFRRIRSPWRLQLQRCSSLKQIQQSFEELINVLNIEQELREGLPTVLDSVLMEELRGLAENQEAAKYQKLSEKMLAELNGWLCGCKDKGREGRLAYHLQSLEAAYEFNGSTLSKEDFAFTPDDTASVMKAVLEERALLDSKIAELSKLQLAGATSVTNEMLRGVTYSASGLGGCYGNTPRCMDSILQCLLPGYCGSPEHDSEATEYSDSEMNEEVGQDAISRHVAPLGPSQETDGSPRSNYLMDIG